MTEDLGSSVPSIRSAPTSSPCMSSMTTTPTSFPIVPLGTKVILQPTLEQKTASGLAIEGELEPLVARGTIVSGVIDSCPSCKTIYSPAYGPGTRVLYKKHAGDLITVNAASYLICDTSSILAIDFELPRDAKDAPAAEAV